MALTWSSDEKTGLVISRFEIGAAIEESLERAEILFHLGDSVRLQREFEQRTRITLGNTGDWRVRLSHGPSFLSSDRPQDFWREYRTLAKSLTLLNFTGFKGFLTAPLGQKSIAV